MLRSQLDCLEAKDNWQATYRNRRTGRYDCLMRTISGRYYWHTPDYDGIPAGATREFTASNLTDSLNRGILELVRGESPIRHEGIYG